MTPPADLGRCLALLALAQKKPGIRLADLARLAHVTVEDVRRDLFDTLLMCGVPPYFPHDYVTCSLDGDRVTVRFAQQFQRPISLTAMEALALKIAVDSLRPPGEQPSALVSGLLAKVETAMADEQRLRFRRLARQVSTDGGLDPEPAITRRLREAVNAGVLADIEYRPAGRDTSAPRRLGPLGIFQRGAAWYAAAFDPAREKVIALRVDRILAVRVLPERCEVPVGFVLEDFAAAGPFAGTDGLPRARIRFGNASARWVREVAQADELTADGDEVVWDAPVADERAFAGFLLSFGGDFVVEGPGTLRERVIDAARVVREKHGA